MQALTSVRSVRQEIPRGQQDHTGAAAHQSKRRSVGRGGDNCLGIGPPRRRGARQDCCRTGGGVGRGRGCNRPHPLRKGASRAVAAPHSPHVLAMGEKGMAVGDDEGNFTVGGDIGMLATIAST